MNTLEDFLLKAITYGLFSPSSFFSMIPDKTLYCCDADNHKFYGIKQDGTILFSFSSGDFKVPICVAAAANGNLYVTAHLYSPELYHCLSRLYHSRILVSLSSVLLSLY
jgi:hypothetical protein